jgi:hypothetical protein
VFYEVFSPPDSFAEEDEKIAVLNKYFDSDCIIEVSSKF